MPPPKPPSPPAPPSICSVVEPHVLEGGVCTSSSTAAIVEWPWLSVPSSNTSGAPAAFAYGVRITIEPCQDEPDISLAFKHNISATSYQTYRRYEWGTDKKLPVNDQMYTVPSTGEDAVLEVEVGC